MNPFTLDDWYSKAVAANELAKRQHSTADPRCVGTPPQHNCQPADLHRIREVVRGVVRAHGIPRNCRIEFACLGQEGSGCAGFEDAPDSFERPFVLLDKGVYQTTDLACVLDVYCGLGLHETGHVLHTRDGYRRLADGMSQLRNLYENLWEDERIEGLIRQASPGFSGYLQTAKRVLLEQGDPGKAVGGWRELSDMDLINAILFAFIRIPHCIPPELRAWKAVNKECVFDTLRSLFPHGPSDESDVAEFAKRLEVFWKRFRQLYPSSTTDKARRLISSNELSLDQMRRISQQLVADIEDRALHGDAAIDGRPLGQVMGDSSERDVVEQMLDEAIQLEKLGRSQARESARRVWSEAAEQLVNRAIQIEALENGADDRSGRRFGLPDLVRILDALTTIQVPLDAEETAAFAEVSSPEIAHTDTWEWDSTRRTTVHRPTAPDEEARLRYDEALCQVRHHVSALRAALMVRHPGQPSYDRDLPNGLLDTQRLVAAAVGGSRRIYKRRVMRPDAGLAICVLLDESGSMSGAKAEATMQVAVLLMEALRTIPTVELQVYSHTSSEANDADCIIRHLAGKPITDHLAIGSYAMGHMGYNYDHQAIQTVANLFRNSTTSQRRWMIVISDGQPNGEGYGGRPAIEATRDAVARARRQGVKVINVAIDDFLSDEMFGAEFVLQFTEISALVNNMRRLVVRLASGNG